MRNGRTLERPFLDLRDRVHYGPNQTPSVEAGMYSMAFDPRYEANRRFYVMYYGARGRELRRQLQGERRPGGRGRPRVAAPGAEDQPPLRRLPQRRAAADRARRQALDLHRRRRLLRRPLRPVAQPRDPARQTAADRPASRARRLPRAGDQPAGRQARPRTPSTPGVCATPGASRSTARPATWRWPMSATATSRARRSTTSAPRPPAAPTSAGRSTRASAFAIRTAPARAPR